MRRFYRGDLVEKSQQIQILQMGVEEEHLEQMQKTQGIACKMPHRLQGIRLW